MAIINVPSSGPDFSTAFLESMFQERQLRQQKEALDLRKKALKLQEDEAELQMAQQQNALQSLLQAFTSGDPFAQQFVEGSTALQGAFQDQALSPEELQSTNVRAAITSLPEARKAFEIGRAQEQALSLLQEEARRLNDPSIFRAGQIALSLQSAGTDASVVRDLLPPTARDIVDLGKARMGLAAAENEMVADDFATSWMKEQGLVPADAPVIPGSHSTLLNVIESREGESINWMQEGIDFITGRIGDSIGGSSPFQVNPDGTLGVNLAGGGGEQVTVEEAVSEWKEFVTRFAPEEQRDKIMERLDSNMFQRRLANERATLQATEILSVSGDPSAAEADIRDILSEDFSKSEIDAILNKARQRANRPKR